MLLEPGDRIPADLRAGPDGWVVDGDPMEGALVSLGIKAGLDPDYARRELPRTDEIPLDAAHRGEGVVPLDISYSQTMTELLAGDGQRVLAFAVRSAPPGKHALAFSDLEGGATPLGLARRRCWRGWRP